MDYQENGGFTRKYVPEESNEEGSLPNRRISYEFLLNVLIEAMKYNADKIGRWIILPQYYVLYFNPEDRKLRQEYEHMPIKALTEEMKAQYKDISQTDPENLLIEFADDEELEHFEVGVVVKMIVPAEKLPNVNVSPKKTDDSLSSEERVKTVASQKSPEAPIALDEFVDIDDDVNVDTHEADTPPDSDEADKPGIEEPVSFYKVYIYKGDKYLDSRELHDNGSLMVGRTPPVDIHFDDRVIHGRHMKLTCHDYIVKCEVLGKNGLFINGAKHSEGEKIKIKNGDEIILSKGSAAYALKIVDGKNEN